MTLIFLTKCALFYEKGDFGLMGIARVKSVFRLCEDNLHFAKMVVDVLIKYRDYTKEELKEDFNEICKFIELVTKENVQVYLDYYIKELN